MKSCRGQKFRASQKVNELIANLA